MSRTARTLQPEEETRVAMAVAVQPFLAATVAFIAFPFLLLDGNGRTLAGGTTDAGRAALSVAVLSGLLALFITFWGGLPLTLFLMKRWRVGLGAAVAAGALFGWLPYLAGVLALGAHGLDGFVRGALFSGLVGGCGGGAFWGIALKEPQSDGVGPS